MFGPHVIPFLPAYIPPDICGPVGMDPATTPVDTCLNLVIEDVRDDGVSASPTPENEGLPDVVAKAQQKGIDLKIVVVNQNPPIDTPLRDIATEVGEAFPGSTVLVLSPTDSGTFSTTFDRMTLEAGQDVAEGRGPVQGSQNFLSELTATHFPWTALTIVVVLGVVAAVIGTRLLQVRAKRQVSRENA
ncbi:Rv1476 family membrane protein [Mycolicibacterium sp. XJ1904]